MAEYTTHRGHHHNVTILIFFPNRSDVVQELCPKRINYHHCGPSMKDTIIFNYRYIQSATSNSE